MNEERKRVGCDAFVLVMLTICSRHRTFNPTHRRWVGSWQSAHHLFVLLAAGWREGSQRQPEAKKDTTPLGGLRNSR